MILEFDSILNMIAVLIHFFGFLPIIMYSEIHYKLPWFRGFLYKKQPEILFDMPKRIVGNQLPVLLMVKDSNRFPVHVEQFKFRVFKNGRAVKSESKRINKSLAQLFYHQLFTFDVTQFAGQDIRVDCTLVVEANNRYRDVKNHNLTRKFSSTFSVYVDTEKLTIPDDWKKGDMHVHSNYTEDQVEFGAPLPAYLKMGRALNLDFIGVLDHAYDFDDVPGTWNFKDENFTKWKNFKKEVEKLNDENDRFTIIPGYELSVDNGLGENVHMAVLNNNEIFQGAGDAMENYKAYASKLYYRNVLDKLEENSLAFAAHPNAPQKFLHRKILKRGQWNAHDFTDKLAGYQILNGNTGGEFYKGKAIWIQKLLSGKKISVFAGTDAHGNFNYNLAIKYPLLSMKQSENHIFGEFFTFLKSGIDQSPSNLTATAKKGASVISNGPFLNLEIRNENTIYSIGDRIDFLPEKIYISAASTDYFGRVDFIRLIVGNCKNKSENSLELRDIDKKEYDQSLGIKLSDGDSYIRAEIKTVKGKIALTNPIWINR